MQTQEKSRPVTAAQLAKRLQLSRTTVSFVLNGKAEKCRIPAATVERVQREAARMHYRPNSIARQLAGKRSNAVGVLINTQAIPDARLIQQMEMLAAERGIRFIVGHAVGTPEQVEEYLEDYYARGVDAVIALFHNYPTHAETVASELARFKHVVYYEKPSGPVGNDACYVEADFYEVGRLGVQHLIDRGKRRIALLLSDLLFPFAQARLQAYKDVLEAAGRQFDNRLTWGMDQRTKIQWWEPFTSDMALRAVEDLVVKEGADGIVVVDDAPAAQIILALNERGFRVPEDVAVVGCNDWHFTTLIRPQLTSINLKTDAIAKAMIDMLFEMLDHGSVPEDRRAVVIAPELVVRNST